MTIRDRDGVPHAGGVYINDRGKNPTRASGGKAATKWEAGGAEAIRHAARRRAQY